MSPMNPRLLRPRAAYAVRYPVRAVHVGGAVRVGPANTVVSPTTNVGGTIGDLMALATVQSGPTVTVDLSADFDGQIVNYASLEIVLVDANSRIVGWGNTRTGYPDDGAGSPPTNGVGGLYLTLTISQFPQITGAWVLNGKNSAFSGLASYAWLPVSPYKIVDTTLIIEPTPPPVPANISLWTADSFDPVYHWSA